MKNLMLESFNKPKPIKDLYQDFSDWQQFQDEFAVRAYNKAMRGLSSVCYRFGDTKAAGNIISAQPGDHLLYRDGSVSLVDSKYSSTHNSLVSCFSAMVSDQLLSQFTRWGRHQAFTWVLFVGPSGVFEVWDGKILVDARRRKAPLKGYLHGRTEHPTYSSAFEQIWMAERV